MKKIVSFVLALVMMLTVAAAVAESPFTAENPGKVSVAVYDRSDMSTEYGTAVDNQWTRWIKEQVKAELNIDVEYVAVPRSGAESTMTTMLAGQNAPDIIFYYDTNRVSDFVAQGGLYDLTELVDTYGANLKTGLVETLPYGQYDGAQYAIPARRGDVGHLGSFIRKDYLDKIGYELKMENGVGYISTSDLYTVLKAWKDQGICEYPMAIATEDSDTECETMEPLYMAFLDNAAFTEEILATQPNFMWPGVKEGFRFYNTLYNEGLIAPDWAQYAGDETEWSNWIATGKSGFWSHAYWQGLKSQTGMLATLSMNDPTAEVVPVCLTNDEGTIGMIDQYAQYGMFVVVPAYSEHAAEAVMYLDWMAKYENFEVINYGFEGEHYVRREDGSHDTTQVAEGASERISVGDLMLVYNGTPDATAYKSELITPEVPTQWVDLYLNAYEASRVSTYVPYLFQQAIESETEYSASLAEKLTELRVKCITCAPADFDATWDGLMAEYLEMGGQEVIDEKVAVYNK